MTRRGAKQKYREGDWFTIPLRDGRHAIGLIARTTKKSPSILFGYFFGPARDVVPEVADTADLQPGAAIWVHMFGDVGLHAGTWQVLGQLPDWQRDAWPMPGFVHKDSLVPGRYTRRDYPGEDPGADPVESRIGEGEIAGLADDGLAGSGFVEQRLTRLLT